MKSGDVKTLVGEYEKIFGGQNPIAGAVRVMPIERLNAILVVTTNSRYLETVKSWLDRLERLA